MGIRGVALLAVFLLVISGCERFSELLSESPASVVKSYLNASIHGEWTEAYGYVSSEDRNEKSLSSFRTDSKKSNRYLSALEDAVSVEVVDEKISGDTAIVRVEVTKPDLRTTFADLLGSAIAKSFSGNAGSKEIENRIKEKIQDSEIPTITETRKYTLLREPNGWRLFFDWRTEDKIDSLLREAEKLRDDQNLIAAKAKYEEVLELDGEVVEAKKAHAEVEEKIAKFERKQSYLSKLELYDLQARYYDTILDKNVPGVRFKLKNNGKRTLSEVEVTVYFKDPNGNTISEENYHPVLVSEYSFGDDKPLKPNYVWQHEQGKFYKASSVPSEWDEGRVTAKITNIEFSSGG